MEKPTIKVVMPLTLMLSYRDLYTSTSRNSLYTNTLTITQYTTAITADSVGVNFPE